MLFACCLGCWLRRFSDRAARGAGVQSLASVSLSGVPVLFVWLFVPQIAEGYGVLSSTRGSDFRY